MSSGTALMKVFHDSGSDVRTAYEKSSSSTGFWRVASSCWYERINLMCSSMSPSSAHCARKNFRRAETIPIGPLASNILDSVTHASLAVLLPVIGSKMEHG